MSHSPTTLDVLKYVRSHMLWQLSLVAQELENRGETAHPVYRPVQELRREVAAATNLLEAVVEDWSVYTDGRAVMSEIELDPGRYLFHTWRPDPAADEAFIQAGHRGDGTEVLVAVTPPQRFELIPLDADDRRTR